MAKESEFNQGVLMAVSLIVATHDLPTVAADVLNEMGLYNADCTELSDFDKENLRRVQGELHGKIRLRGL
ncbi:hypothetical protein EVC37_21820 [Methylocaldum sp. BRCS4]|nr:hypothetical protein [Methylocaldum sp. BRCS4]